MSIAEKLAKIQALSTSLNAETDDLNETFRLIEKGLAGSGVTFWWREHEFGSHIENGGRHYFRLGYTKIGESWCMAMKPCVTVELDELPVEGEDSVYDDPVPLTRSPRVLRIAVSVVLEEFLDAYAGELAEMEDRVRRAKAFAKTGGAPIK